MKTKFINISKGAVLLLLFFSTNTAAQIVTDSIKTAFLPAISYNSDFGLASGGLLHRFHYKGDTEPYYSFVQVAAIFSTKGLASTLIEWDKPHIFKSNYRLTSSIYAARFFEDNYYGYGNYTKIEDSFNVVPEVYNYNSVSAGFDARLRIPIFDTQRSSIDIISIINFDYKTPFNSENTQLIVQESPLGVDGDHSLHLGTGLIWENRNNELRPTKGTYAETNIEVGQKWFGSGFNTFIFKAEASSYLSFHLLKEITWANRISVENTSGDVPYWKLASLGDEETLRGFPSQRFLDDNSILFNTELRTWLFNIDLLNSEFGGTLFFDIGRTYANKTDFSSILRDLRYSFGFGGTSSLFTPDFVLRTDVGFSKEGIGIYFTSGYMF